MNVGSVVTALTLVTLHTSKPLCMCISPTHLFASRKPYDYDHKLLPMEVISGCGIHEVLCGNTHTCSDEPRVHLIASPPFYSLLRWAELRTTCPSLQGFLRLIVGELKACCVLLLSYDEVMW